jgi:hypothetical protein
MTNAQLLPFLGGISGTSAAGAPIFNGVTDVIGGRSPIPGMNVRDAIQVLNPNTLIIELPNGTDLGTIDMIINTPTGVPCPW